MPCENVSLRYSVSHSWRSALDDSWSCCTWHHTFSTNICQWKTTLPTFGGLVLGLYRNRFLRLLCTSICSFSPIEIQIFSNTWIKISEFVRISAKHCNICQRLPIVEIAVNNIVDRKIVAIATCIRIQLQKSVPTQPETNQALVIFSQQCSRPWDTRRASWLQEERVLKEYQVFIAQGNVLGIFMFQRYWHKHIFSYRCLLGCERRHTLFGFCYFGTSRAGRVC